MIFTYTQRKQETRFWPRQFSNHVTTPQLIFDVVVGAIAPILCYIFDPIVFNDSFGGPPAIPVFVRLKLLVYLFSGLAIITLVLWLILRGRRSRLNATIAGILFSGAFFSLLIGVLIFPLSLLGLMVLIGVFGFTPFLVAFVYLRNGVRALNAAKPLLDKPQMASLLLLGAVLVIGPPVIAHWQVSRIVTQSMNDLLTGDAHAAESATARLRKFSWAADLDQVVWKYSRETDQTRKDILGKAYREITGHDIRSRQTFLLD
jgi:hypothetical protein